MQANRLTNHQKIVRLVVCAMLTALGVVLGGLLSIPAMPFGSYTLKIGFGVLPVIGLRRFPSPPAMIIAFISHPSLNLLLPPRHDIFKEKA